jgi:hypothetical protein
MDAGPELGGSYVLVGGEERDIVLHVRGTDVHHITDLQHTRPNPAQERAAGLSDDHVVSEAETALILGVSRWTLARKRKEPDAGGLPYVKLSAARIGYTMGTIRAYQRARRVGRLPNEPATNETGNSPKAA